MTPRERFEDKFIVEPSGHWRWTACIVSGYGQIKYGSKWLKANRVSWLLYKGEIPEGISGI